MLFSAHGCLSGQLLLLNLFAEEFLRRQKNPSASFGFTDSVAVTEPKIILYKNFNKLPAHKLRFITSPANSTGVRPDPQILHRKIRFVRPLR